MKRYTFKSNKLRFSIFAPSLAAAEDHAHTIHKDARLLWITKVF